MFQITSSFSSEWLLDKELTVEELLVTWLIWLLFELFWLKDELLLFERTE